VKHFWESYLFFTVGKRVKLQLCRCVVESESLVYRRAFAYMYIGEDKSHTISLCGVDDGTCASCIKQTLPREREGAKRTEWGHNAALRQHREEKPVWTAETERERECRVCCRYAY
jgi:hypothetical protein